MLKGNTKIQLFDSVSGKEVQRVEKHNMITNAITKLVSPPLDYLMNSNLSYYTCLNDCMPLSTKGLAGILLWENVIEENANIVVSDFGNKLIGKAGSTYSGTNRYRGSLNANESGDITNGKRFVWDFGTDRANGTISAVSLTSLVGGDCSMGDYVDNIPCFSTIGYQIFNNLGINQPFIAELEPNQTVRYELNGKNLTLKYAQQEKSTELHYTHSPTTTSLIKHINIELPFDPHKDYAFIDDKGNLRFQKYDRSIRKLQYCTIDIKTGEMIDNQTVTIGSLPSTYKTSWNNVAVYGGHIYGMGERNVSDSNRYDIVAHDMNGNFEEVLQKGYGSLYDGYPNGVINGALFVGGWSVLKGLSCIHMNTIASSGISKAYKILYTYRNIYPYCLVCSETYNSNVYLVKINPYIGSINNLATPVIKTNAQTMKITYEVTEV